MSTEKRSLPNTIRRLGAAAAVGVNAAIAIHPGLPDSPVKPIPQITSTELLEHPIALKDREIQTIAHIIKPEYLPDPNLLHNIKFSPNKVLVQGELTNGKLTMDVLYPQTLEKRNTFPVLREGTFQLEGHTVCVTIDVKPNDPAKVQDLACVFQAKTATRIGK